MAAIGLDEMYYAKITSADDADEVYDTPKKMAGAISVDIAKNIAEAMLSADNRAYYANKSFSNGTITINLADISERALKVLNRLLGLVGKHSEGRVDLGNGGKVVGYAVEAYLQGAHVVARAAERQGKGGGARRYARNGRVGDYIDIVAVIVCQYVVGYVPLICKRYTSPL